MFLKDIIDNVRTDKNTTHDYLDLYQELLAPLQLQATKVLEVGIWMAGSIKMWHTFFTNATIYGIDKLPLDQMDLEDWVKCNNRIILKTGVDAYNEDVVKTHFVNDGLIFDFILDDGPHTLESMIKFINLYSSLMSDIGILMIEDIPDLNWTEILKTYVPEHLKQYIHVYDLRQNKGQYNDIVFVINKNKLLY